MVSLRYQTGGLDGIQANPERGGLLNHAIEAEPAGRAFRFYHVRSRNEMRLEGCLVEEAQVVLPRLASHRIGEVEDCLRWIEIGQPAEDHLQATQIALLPPSLF